MEDRNVGPQMPEEAAGKLPPCQPDLGSAGAFLGGGKAEGRQRKGITGREGESGGREVPWVRQTGEEGGVKIQQLCLIQAPVPRPSGPNSCQCRLLRLAPAI